MSGRSLFVVALLAAPAHAWESDTYAGLTEQAAVSASLHRRLAGDLDRSLGLFEQLALRRAPGDELLMQRLRLLDPEGGYAPDPQSPRGTALGWLVAGAVVEGVPAERQRHHYYDPASGSGLDEGGGARGARTRLNEVYEGTGSLRGLFTGSAFDGSGQPSLTWLTAADNEWGLRRFLDERERAASAATADERSDALARALLAAGAIARIVEAAGDPALVRNDYRVAAEAAGAPLERYVEKHYGRLALPVSSGPPIARAHLAELIHDGAGGGLADRTQRRFFSPGTLPASGRYALPVASEGDGAAGYVASADVAHLAAWRRSTSGTEWFLDERCHHDYAEALLPEIGRYAAGALALLFRGRLDVETAGDAVRVRAAEVGLGDGQLTLYADVGPGGARKKMASVHIGGAATGEPAGALARPATAKHLTVVFRGVDEHGEPLVLVRELAL